MRILLLNRSYYPHIGGIENSLYYLSREYKKTGYEVTILTEKIEGDYQAREEFADIITYPKYRINKFFLPILPLVQKKKIVAWIKNTKDKVKADAVVCRDPLLGLAYLEVYPDANITYIPAVVIKQYNKGVRKSNSISGFVKEVLRYLQLKIEEKQQAEIIKHSRKVVVFSENVKKQITENRMCDIDKITVCHPGVADKFRFEIPREHDKNETVNFLFVGRLVAEKNLDMLLNAFKQLEFKNKKLTLVGDGIQRNILENRVKELSLSECVAFIGESSEPEKFYNEADFFVIPSSYESFGQVIIEALASGVPVIGFPTINGKTLTAVDELVKDGITGFICKDFSSDSLRICLEKAVVATKDSEKYYSMKSNAAKFTSQHCSWTKLAEICLL